MKNLEISKFFFIFLHLIRVLFICLNEFWIPDCMCRSEHCLQLLFEYHDYILSNSAPISERIFYQIIIIIVALHIFSFLNPFKTNLFFDRKSEKNFSQCIYPEDNDSLVNPRWRGGNRTKEMIGEWKRIWSFDFSFGETCNRHGKKNQQR